MDELLTLVLRSFLSTALFGLFSFFLKLTNFASIGQRWRMPFTSSTVWLNSSIFLAWISSGSSLTVVIPDGSLMVTTSVLECTEPLSAGRELSISSCLLALSEGELWVLDMLLTATLAMSLLTLLVLGVGSLMTSAVSSWLFDETTISSTSARVSSPSRSLLSSWTILLSGVNILAGLVMALNVGLLELLRFKDMKELTRLTDAMELIRFIRGGGPSLLPLESFCLNNAADSSSTSSGESMVTLFATSSAFSSIWSCLLASSSVGAGARVSSSSRPLLSSWIRSSWTILLSGVNILVGLVMALNVDLLELLRFKDMKELTRLTDAMELIRFIRGGGPSLLPLESFCLTNAADSSSTSSGESMVTLFATSSAFSSIWSCLLASSSVGAGARVSSSSRPLLSSWIRSSWTILLSGVNILAGLVMALNVDLLELFRFKDMKELTRLTDAMELIRFIRGGGPSLLPLESFCLTNTADSSSTSSGESIVTVFATESQSMSDRVAWKWRTNHEMPCMTSAQVDGSATDGMWSHLMEMTFCYVEIISVLIITTCKWLQRSLNAFQPLRTPFGWRTLLFWNPAAHLAIYVSWDTVQYTYKDLHVLIAAVAEQWT